jgi:hypothetical protein
MSLKKIQGRNRLIRKGRTGRVRRSLSKVVRVQTYRNALHILWCLAKVS